VSLRLDIISHQSIFWVLMSLKRDEMAPSERSILSRIKEAFALRISNGYWSFIYSYIESKSVENVPV
jgi:hypothetical protein